MGLRFVAWAREWLEWAAAILPMAIFLYVVSGLVSVAPVLAIPLCLVGSLVHGILRLRLASMVGALPGDEAAIKGE